MNTSVPASVPTDTSPDAVPSRLRIRFGLFTVLIGLLIFMIGTKPSIFALDRSPVVGFVQISVFLVGLAIICVGGYISLLAFWKNGERTIPADIGSRMVATGYVVAVFAGMADVFGFGSQPLPNIPYFGPWQALGVEIGEALIAVGFLLLVPFGRLKSKKPVQS
jgi:hypothetical protein